MLEVKNVSYAYKTKKDKMYLLLSRRVSFIPLSVRVVQEKQHSYRC